MRNLWASNTGRNPSIGWGGVFNFVNNVVFNWQHRTADGGDYTMMCNFINNYYKPGPATPRDKPIAYRIVNPEGRSGKMLPWRQFGRVYASGNIVEGNPQVTLDNWAGGIQLTDKDGYQGTNDDMLMMRSDEPFVMAPLTVMDAGETLSWVLQNVGATLPCRDIVDQRVIDEVRTGLFRHRHLPNDSYKQGIITDPRQMGGYPEYGAWTPYVDSDMDGMPDEWELLHGLNPNDPSDANADFNGDGYTNIEKYINGTGADVRYAKQ